MGFIPIFLTMGGACLLFFLTVRNTMQQKLNRHHELIQELRKSAFLSGLLDKAKNMTVFFQQLKSAEAKSAVDENELTTIREVKVNRIQFNTLIKKAPYNWVAKISGFQPIT